MATRCYIAKQLKTKIKAIYSHWDGYPAHNGRILLEHYSDEKKLDALLRLGSISILGKDIGEKHDFDQYDSEVVTAYHRDRNDLWEQNKPFSAKSELDLINRAKGIDYLYLFKNGKWYYCDTHAPQKTFVELTQFVCETVAM